MLSYLVRSRLRSFGMHGHVPQGVPVRLFQRVGLQQVRPISGMTTNKPTVKGLLIPAAVPTIVS
jgi:hypothetical protein